MDDSHIVLWNESGGQLTTYIGGDMQTYYKMFKPTEYANDEVYTRVETLDTTDVIKTWRWEPSMFFHHPSIADLTKIHIDVYQYFIAMYYGLYGLKNDEVFQSN